jgi:hypothetical protein
MARSKLDTSRHNDDRQAAPKPPKKLKGNQNVREDGGRFAKETLAGQPGHNVETDKRRPKPEAPVIQPGLESQVAEVLGRLEMADRPEEAATVRADALLLIDAAIMDAGLDPDLKTEGLSCQEALALYENGMLICRHGWWFGFRQVEGSPVAYRIESGQPIDRTAAASAWVYTPGDFFAKDWMAL